MQGRKDDSNDAMARRRRDVLFVFDFVRHSARALEEREGDWRREFKVLRVILFLGVLGLPIGLLTFFLLHL